MAEDDKPKSDDGQPQDDEQLEPKSGGQEPDQDDVDASRAPAAAATASWRSSSPIWSTSPSGRSRPATRPCLICCAASGASRKASSPTTAAAWSSAWVTASWPSSTS